MRLLAGLVLLSCAPLSTLTMSDRCRDEYDACLNRCPRMYSSPTQIQPEVASCTSDCNRQSRECK